MPQSIIKLKYLSNLDSINSLVQHRMPGGLCTDAASSLDGMLYVSPERLDPSLNISVCMCACMHVQGGEKGGAERETDARRQAEGCMLTTPTFPDGPPRDKCRCSQGEQALRSRQKQAAHSGQPPSLSTPAASPQPVPFGSAAQPQGGFEFIETCLSQSLG